MKIRKQFSFSRKLISIFLSGIMGMLETSAFLPVAEARPFLTASHPEKIVQALQALELNEALGRVEKFFSPEQTDKSTPVIIYLQSAHTNYDSETHIRKMIHYFQGRFALPLVLLEGGEGRLDSLFFKSFPDEALKQKLVDEYVRKGELSGGETAAILERTYFTEYYGIEDSRLYERNKQAFFSASQNERQALVILNSLEARMISKAQGVFSPGMEKFRRQRKDFQDEFLHLVGYLSVLEKAYGLHEKEEIEKNFPELFKILENNRHQKHVEKRKLDIVMRRFLARFRHVISGRLILEEQKELNRLMQAYHTGETEAGPVVKRMEEFALKLAIRLPVPAILRQEAYQAWTLESIKGSSLFSQIAALEDQVAEKLLDSDDARELWIDFKKLDRLRSMASLELVPSDWEIVKQSDVSGFFRAFESEGNLRRLWALLKPHYDFYRLAEERDRTLFDNALKKAKKKKAPVALIVTGGFHSGGITAKLEEHSVPYVLITPSIRELGEKSLYFDVMSGNARYMQYFRGSLWDALAQDYSSRLAASIDPNELSPALKAWRDRIIQNAIAEKRIAEANTYTRYLDALVQSLRKKMQSETPVFFRPLSHEEIRSSLGRELDRFLTLYFERFQSQSLVQLDAWIGGLRKIWAHGSFSANTAHLATSLALIREQNFRPPVERTPRLQPEEIRARSEALQNLPVPLEELYHALTAFEALTDAQEEIFSGPVADSIKDTLQLLPAADVGAIIAETKDRLAERMEFFEQGRAPPIAALPATLSARTAPPVAPRPDINIAFTGAGSHPQTNLRVRHLVEDKYRIQQRREGKSDAEIERVIARARTSGTFLTVQPDAVIKHEHAEDEKIFFFDRLSEEPEVGHAGLSHQHVYATAGRWDIAAHELAELRLWKAKEKELIALGEIHPGRESGKPADIREWIQTHIEEARILDSRFHEIGKGAETRARAEKANDAETLSLLVYQVLESEVSKSLSKIQQEYESLKKKRVADEKHQAQVREAEKRLAEAEGLFRAMREGRVNEELRRSPDSLKKIEDLLAQAGVNPEGRSPASSLEALVSSPAVQDAYRRSMDLVRDKFEKELTELLVIQNPESTDEHHKRLEALGDRMRAALEQELKTIAPEIRNIVIPVVLIETTLRDPAQPGKSIEFLGKGGDAVRKGSQADLYGRGRSNLIAAIGLVLGLDISAPTGIGKTMAIRLAMGMAKTLGVPLRTALVLENNDAEGKFFKKLEKPGGKKGMYEGFRPRTAGTDTDFAQGVTDYEIAALLGYRLVRASDYIGEGKKEYAALHEQLKHPRAVLVMDIFSGAQLANQFDTLSEQGKLDALDVYQFIESFDLRMVDEAQIPALHRVRAITSQGGEPKLAKRERIVQRGLSAAQTIDNLREQGKFQIVEHSNVELFLEKFGQGQDSQHAIGETPAILLTDEGVEMNRAATLLFRKELSKYGFRTQREFKSFIQALYGKEAALVPATVRGKIEFKPYDSLKGVEKNQQSSDIPLQVASLYRLMKEVKKLNQQEIEKAAKENRAPQLVSVRDIVNDLESEDNKDEKGNPGLTGNELIEGVNLNPGWVHRWFLSWFMGPVKVDVKKLNKWFRWTSIGRLDTKTGTPIQELFSKGVRALSATLPIMIGLFTGNPLIDLGTSRPDLQLYQKAGRLNLGVIDLDNDSDIEQLGREILKEGAKKDKDGNPVNPVVVVPLMKYQGALKDKLLDEFKLEEKELRDIGATTTSEAVAGIEREGADQKFVILGPARIATGRDFKGQLAVFGVGIEDFSSDLLAQLIGRDRSNQGQIYLYATQAGLLTHLSEAARGAEAGDFEKFLKRQIGLLEEELADTEKRLLNETDDTKRKFLLGRKADQETRIQEAKKHLKLFQTLHGQFKTRPALRELEILLQRLVKEPSQSIELDVLEGEKPEETVKQIFTLADFFGLNAQYRYMMTQSQAGRFIVTTMARNEILTRPLKALISRLLQDEDIPEAKKRSYLAALAQILKEVEEGKILDTDTYLDARITSGEEFVRNELEMQINFILGEDLREEGLLQRLEREGFSGVQDLVNDVFRVTELREIKRAIKGTNEFSLPNVQQEAARRPQVYSLAFARNRSLRDYFKTLVLFGDYITASHQTRSPAAGAAERVHVALAKQEENPDGRFQRELSDVIGNETLAAKATEQLKARSELRGHRISQAALSFKRFLEAVKTGLENDLYQTSNFLNGLKRLIEHSGYTVDQPDCSGAGSCMALAVSLAGELQRQNLFDPGAQGQNLFNRLHAFLSNAGENVGWPDLVRALRAENPDAALARLLLDSGAVITAQEKEGLKDAFVREAEAERYKETALKIGKRISYYSEKVQAALQRNPWLFTSLQYYFPSWSRLQQLLLRAREKVAGWSHQWRSAGKDALYEKTLQPLFGGRKTVGALWRASEKDLERTVEKIRREAPELTEGQIDLLRRNWRVFEEAFGPQFFRLSYSRLSDLLRALEEVEKEAGQNAFMGSRVPVAREAYRLAFGREAVSPWKRMLNFMARPFSKQARRISRLEDLIQRAKAAYFRPEAIHMLRIAKIRAAEEGCKGAGCAALDFLIEAFPSYAPYKTVLPTHVFAMPHLGLSNRLPSRAKKPLAKISREADPFESFDPVLGKAWGAIQDLNENILGSDAKAAALTLADLQHLASKHGLPESSIWDLAHQVDGAIKAPETDLLQIIKTMGLDTRQIHVSELKDLSGAASLLEQQMKTAGRPGNFYSLDDFLRLQEGFLLSPVSLRILARAAGAHISADLAARLSEIFPRSQFFELKQVPFSAQGLRDMAARYDVLPTGFEAQLRTGLENTKKLDREYARLKMTQARDLLRQGNRKDAAVLLDEAFRLDPDRGRQIAEMEFDFRVAGGKDHILRALRFSIEKLEEDLRAHRDQYLPEEITGLEKQLALLKKRERSGDVRIDPNADAAAYNGNGTVYFNRNLLIAMNRLRRDPALGRHREEVILASIGFYLLHEETEGHLDVLKKAALEKKIAAMEGRADLSADEQKEREYLKTVYFMVAGYPYGAEGDDMRAGANDFGKAFRDYQANLFEMYLMRALPSELHPGVFYAFEGLSALWGQRGYLDKITPYRQFVRDGKEGSPLVQEDLLKIKGTPWTDADSPVRIFNDYFRANSVFGYIFEFKDALENGLYERAEAILKREKSKNYDSWKRKLPEPNIGEPMLRQMRELLPVAKLKADERKEAVSKWWRHVEESALYLFRLYHVSDTFEIAASEEESFVQLVAGEDGGVVSEEVSAEPSLRSELRLAAAEKAAFRIAEGMVSSLTRNLLEPVAADIPEFIVPGMLKDLEVLYGSDLSFEDAAELIRMHAEDAIKKIIRKASPRLEDAPRDEIITVIEKAFEGVFPEDLTDQDLWETFARGAGLAPKGPPEDPEFRQWALRVRNLLKRSMGVSTLLSDVKAPVITHHLIDTASGLLVAVKGILESRTIEYRLSPRLEEGGWSDEELSTLAEVVKNTVILNTHLNVRFITPSLSAEKKVRRALARAISKTERDLIPHDRITVAYPQTSLSLITMQKSAHLILTDNVREALHREEESEVFDSLNYADGSRIRYEGQEKVSPADLFLAAVSALSQEAFDSLVRYESGVIRVRSQEALSPYALLAQMIAQEVQKVAAIQRSA